MNAMITNELMWRAIFNSFSHPCEVTDVMVKPKIAVGVDMLTEVMLGVNVDMLSDMEIIVMVNPEVTLEFVVSVAYVVGVRVGVLTVLIIDSVIVIDVDMLADENVNGLAAVMTPLEFTLLSP